MGTKKFYDPPELKTAKEKLKAHLIPHIPDKPFDGPLRLIVRWCFPIAGKHHDGEYKHTKPDTDDLNKSLKDIMEKLGFYVNDSRAVSYTHLPYHLILWLYLDYLIKIQRSF